MKSLSDDSSSSKRAGIAKVASRPLGDVMDEVLGMNVHVVAGYR